MLRGQCANRECSGLELHRTGSNVSDNAGVCVATFQVPLSHCCGCDPLGAKHPTAGGIRKNSGSQCEIFAEKNLRAKAPSFLQKYGFENARKISDHFLRFLVLVRLQGLFLKISHQAMLLFSLTKCALVRKVAKPSKRFWGVPAWQSTLHENNHEKSKKSHGEVSAPGVEQRFSVPTGPLISSDSSSSDFGSWKKRF